MKIEQWAIGLWGFVDDNLVAGRPFYLCVDVQTLELIAQNMSVNFGSTSAAEEDFLLSCSSKLNIFADRVSIDRTSFEPQSDGRSIAICFAVQQVLAAERMIGDDDGSRDAYYARYRQILGLDPHGIGSPLPYAQFTQIWSTFRLELLSLSDAGNNAVTFRQGTGKNKYRALPISQALLDQESLKIIHERVPDILGRSDDDLIHRVRRVSRHLSKKSREKVYIDPIRLALLGQIRSFTLELPTQVRKQQLIKGHVVNAADFFIYIDDDGWDDVYRLGIRNMGERADAIIDIAEYLETYFNHHSVLPFKEGSVADFEGVPSRGEVLSDATLVVLRDSELKRIGSSWPNCFEELGLCNIPDGYRMLLRDLSIPIAPFPEKPTSPETAGGMSFTGGIVVDRVRQTFLAGFTPTEVQFNGKTLSGSDVLTVNGETILISQFLDELKGCVGTRDFRVSSDAGDEYLGVATTREFDRVDIGYPIRGGFCAVTSVSIYDEDAILHLHVSDDIAKSAALARRIDRSELVKHLSIPDCQWVPAPLDIGKAILRLAEHELSGSMIWRRSISEIRRRCALPVTLLMISEETLRNGTSQH